MAQYTSKKGIINASAMTVFDRITDSESMMASIPEDKRDMVKIEGDSLIIEYAGFSLGINLKEKVPFSKIVLEDGQGAPFHFIVTINIDPVDNPAQCEMWIQVDADLNFMMRSLLGGKIQQGLDQAIDAFSTGKVPSF